MTNSNYAATQIQNPQRRKFLGTGAKAVLWSVFGSGVCSLVTSCKDNSHKTADTKQQNLESVLKEDDRSAAITKEALDLYRSADNYSSKQKQGEIYKKSYHAFERAIKVSRAEAEAMDWSNPDLKVQFLSAYTNALMWESDLLRKSADKKFKVIDGGESIELGLENIPPIKVDIRKNEAWSASLYKALVNYKKVEEIYFEIAERGSTLPKYIAPTVLGGHDGAVATPEILYNRQIKTMNPLIARGTIYHQKLEEELNGISERQKKLTSQFEINAVKKQKQIY